MIKIHKIEVENIRSLGRAVFSPLTDGGMTAVNGPNGAGKSSLLCALLWAVYGVTPDGVPQSAMRRQGSEGQTCRVVAEFEHEGQIVTVERGLKGRNDSPYLIISVNGVEQAKGSIRAGTAWLVSLLGGLDAEGFMTAFVIRQKELDGLVKAKPAERRKLIERLAGIDRMSTAIKSAREEETEVKRRIEVLPGDPEALAEAKAALEEAQQNAIDLWETYEAAVEAETAAQQTFTAAEQAAVAMQARVDAHAEAKQRLSEANHTVALTKQRLDAAERDLGAVTAQAQGGTDAEVAAAQAAFDAATAAVQANRQAREGADRAVETARQDSARAAQAKERAQRARAVATQARDAAETAATKASGFPADLPAQVTKAEQDLAEATEKVGSLRGEYGRLGNSIAAMEATTDGDSCCPTCSTALRDPSLVLASLREAQTRVQAQGKATGAQVSELEARVQTLRAQVTAATAAQTEARHLSEQAKTAENAATDAERDAGEADAAAVISQQAAEDAKAQALSAAQQTATLTAALETAQAALRAAQVAAAAAARIPQATADRDAAWQASADAITAQVEAENAELAARAGLSEKDTIFEAFRTAQTALAAAERDKVAAHGNFRVSEEQVKAAEKARDTEDMKLRARAEAYAELERKTAVREALDFFRKDRIASLAPELSEIATDQIARMTDGKYVAVELDEEFTPVLTDDKGRMRPVTWLSGGEESAVALALRLAIGEVIAGQQGGLLWMDEPQTAMDAQRRPAMMSVVRDLPGRQVVIISHVTEATDMVDLVLEVVPDDEHGSTVVVTGTTEGTEDLDALDTIDA